MKKVLRWLDINFEPVIIGILFYAVMIIVTVQVIMRFVFSSGMNWGEELARYMFVWLMYFGFSYATRNNRHIRVGFFVERMKPSAQKVILIICDLLFLALMGLSLAAAIITCQAVAYYKDFSVTLNVSMNVLYSAGVVGFLLMALRLVQSIVWKIRHFKSEMEVFQNADGKYSGAEELFFMPESAKDDPIDKSSSAAAKGKGEDEW